MNEKASMKVTKGLIIDEPWITKILKGEKVWEMRSTQASLRGYFALIRKGSGTVVGVANLQAVSGPYDQQSLADNAHKHRVGPDLYSLADYKWWYAWELTDVCSLASPVKYVHKNGAVTWVQLDQATIDGIQQQLSSEFGEMEETECRVGVSYQMQPQVVESAENEIRITLTQGNINNAHFYIPRDTDLFHESVWGGRNKTEAGKPARFKFDGIESSVLSDIDGAKKILRNRSLVRQFFEIHRAVAGEQVKIRKSTAGDYRISLHR